MYEKKHVCRNCKYFNSLYTKGIVKFNKKSYGECEKISRQVKNSDECEFWEDNTEIRRNRQELAQRNILFSLENISEIINLLKTDYDEDNEN